MSTDAVLREFRRDDTPHVAQFLSAYFAPLPPEEWTRVLDRMLWRNPNLRETTPAGWVLEAGNGTIAGFLGNVVHPFKVAQATVRAAATTAWCVAPAYRSLGLLQAEAFFEQPDVDLLMNTSANDVSGELFRLMGGRRLPIEDFDQILFWIVQPFRFAAGALRHLSNSPAVATIGQFPAGLALLTWERGTRRRFELPAAVDIGDARRDRWSDVWSDWSDGLTAGIRTDDQLAWRFSDPAYRWISVRTGDGSLLGYIAAIVFTDHGGALRRLRVRDLWCNRASHHDVRTLLAAAYTVAQNEACGSMELCAGAPLRSAIEATRPYRRRARSFPYYIYSRDRALDRELAVVARWYAAEYDGDSPFGLAAVYGPE